MSAKKASLYLLAGFLTALIFATYYMVANKSYLIVLKKGGISYHFIPNGKSYEFENMKVRDLILEVRSRNRILQRIKINSVDQVFYCISNDNKSIFFMSNYEVGHYFNLCNYNIKTEVIDTLSYLSGFLGIFKSGNYKDCLLITRLELSDDAILRENILIIDSDNNIVFDIGNEEAMNSFMKDKWKCFQKATIF